MGAGTGDLNSSTDTFNFLLTFVSDTGGTGIDKTDVIYKCFRSALDFLISGLRGVKAAEPTVTENISGGKVTSIYVVVRGRLVGDDRRNFNRALNRLLWGVRERRSPEPPPSPSHWTVNTDKDNWIDEDT